MSWKLKVAREIKHQKENSEPHKHVQSLTTHITSDTCSLSTTNCWATKQLHSVTADYAMLIPLPLQTGIMFHKNVT